MLTAIGGGYYRVYRDGVEFSKHIQEREAIESAYQCKADYPCARVCYRHDYEVEVAKVPVARTFERDAEGDGYCYSRPPDDGVGPSAPVLDGAPSNTSVVLNWSPALDDLSGILDYQIERSVVSPESFSLLATVGSAVTTYTDTVGNSASWKYRVRGRDNAPVPNNGTYSNTVTVTTPPSAEQLEPGQVSIDAASYSALEGGGITITVSRTGQGVSSPAVLCDYTISGFSEGTPQPASGELSWAAATGGADTIQLACGQVTANRSGTITLSNLRAASGSLQPTFGRSSASITIQNIVPAAGFTAEPGLAVSAPAGFVAGATVTISGSGFGTKPGSTGGPLYCFDFGRSGTLTKHPASRGSSSGSWSSTVITSGVVAPARSYSAQFTRNGGGAMGLLLTDTDGNETKFWGFVRNRIPWDGLDAYAAAGSTWNVKHWRYWGGTASFGEGHNNYLLLRSYGQQNRADGLPRFNSGGTTSGSSGGNTPTASVFGLQKNTWRYDELRVQHDSGAATDTASAWTMTQGVEWGHTNNPFRERDAGETRWRRLYLHQFENLPNGTPWQINYDFMLVEDSWCRVVISERSTWSDSVEHEREPQIPLTWATDEVSFECRPGVFGSLSGKYLYVVTNANTPIKIGRFD